MHDSEVRPYTPPGAEFVQDLSGMTTTPKPGWPKGKPRGPRKQH